MATITEIETRCRVRNPKKFRKRLRHLDVHPAFPDVSGVVRELNLNFSHPKRPEKVFRLRRRRFSNGDVDFSYTEKGKNTHKTLRVKKEKTKNLRSQNAYDAKAKELVQHGFQIDFAYQREFLAEDYQIYKGIAIELFQFPRLGWFVEFEVHRGSEKDLLRVMKEFGLTFKDNIRVSTKDMWKKYCRKHNLQKTNTLLFKRAERGGI